MQMSPQQSSGFRLHTKGQQAVICIDSVPQRWRQGLPACAKTGIAYQQSMPTATRPFRSSIKVTGKHAALHMAWALEQTGAQPVMETFMLRRY